MNLCQLIDCPFFNNRAYVLGCIRYSTSSFCHLLKIIDAESNESYLSIPTYFPIEGLEQENKKFFLDDSYYQETLDFQRDFPELFDKDKFKVREI